MLPFILVYYGPETPCIIYLVLFDFHFLWVVGPDVLEMVVKFRFDFSVIKIEHYLFFVVNILC